MLVGRETAATWFTRTRHRSWPYRIVQRLKRPAWVVALAIGLLYYAIFLLLVLWRGDEIGMARLVSRTALGFPVTMITFFMLSCILDRALETMLRDLRPVVRLDDADYARVMATMIGMRPIENWLMIGIAVLLGPVGTYASTSGIDGVLRVYILLGVFLISVGVVQVLILVLHGLDAIRGMQRFSLAIDIFDTDNLAPVAWLSLKMSIMVTVMAALTVLFWGLSETPSTPFALVVMFVLSAAAFFLPLRGLHQQMLFIKNQELSRVQTMVREAYEDLKIASDADRHQRAETLSYLIQTEARVVAAPTWPYNLTMLWQLAATLLIPLALTVLQIVW